MTLSIPKQYTLAELIYGLDDVVLRGDPDCKITGVATLQQAGSAQITFLTNPLYKKYLTATQAAAVILTPHDAKDYKGSVIISSNPYYIYAKIAGFFEQKKHRHSGIHPTAIIGEHCNIHTSVSIGPYCVIRDGVKIAERVVIDAGCIIEEEVEIAADTRIDARVVVYPQVKIGKSVRIASGAVIGSDGFGYARHKAKWQRIPQLGRVIIGDEVEIGANTTIDCGAIDDTIIGAGAKLDNLIQVGHNVRIGEDTVIAGCTGIAGSSVIGKGCMIGGGSGIAGHITLADNVVITGMTAVSKSIREPGIYSSGVGGVVANQEWRKNSARVHRLEQLMERVKALEAILQKMEES
ncbi:MAG: UDP-3-O-(3-hydroxymyristoyl)glucosamine N-acyltransferase [Gammaproteobacteria bacterium RIFCSPHIGHO2_12_FULL_41_20]|nr:MAG: UDP-3-O-(3-hydroxymyristoyl)glucosamine N-acyltransferase [Gammaproteobacteria bacterium RIFCSPHIGHO2_12_FULL_41_20]